MGRHVARSLMIENVEKHIQLSDDSVTHILTIAEAA